MRAVPLLLAAAAGTVAVAVLAATVTDPVVGTTDEDRVRAVLDTMNGSYNRSDFDSFAAQLCAEVRDAAGYEAGWRRSRASDGPTRIDVNSVSVTGGGAVANVRFRAANHPDTKTFDIDFRREGTAWKACRYHAPRTV